MRLPPTVQVKPETERSCTICWLWNKFYSSHGRIVCAAPLGHSCHGRVWTVLRFGAKCYILTGAVANGPMGKRVTYMSRGALPRQLGCTALLRVSVACSQSFQLWCSMLVQCPPRAAEEQYLVHQVCLSDAEGTSNARSVLFCDACRLQTFHVSEIRVFIISVSSLTNNTNN